MPNVEKELTRNKPKQELKKQLEGLKVKRFKYDTVEKIYKHYCKKCECYKLQSAFYTAYDYVCIECSKKEKRPRRKYNKKTDPEKTAQNKRIKETIANLKNNLHN